MTSSDEKYLALKGVNNFNTKLTPAKVRAIRASKMKHVALANHYGVSQSTISRILSRRIWNWLK